MNRLELKSVNDLLELEDKFFIPAYQRGYRWKERQVIDLLEDITEFQEKEDKKKGEFYCLQPIVVTKTSNGWEVIDGQQRLTTLYILLSYLEAARELLFNSSHKFSISYETREKENYSSKKFLEQILNTTQKDNSNIDFYHMSQTFLCIKKWFEATKTNKGDFLNVLLKSKYKNNKDRANNVRFIWYEVNTKNENDGKKIFTRINMGKIPLTNAELIKALFLIDSGKSKNKREKYQQKIAYEWDNIENKLQDNNFWFFLNKSISLKPTRIEFIFDLIANKYKDKVTDTIKKSDNYYTFYIFNSLISNNIKTKNELWKEIKTYFRTFEEWYNNNEYYHLIGYLIHTGIDVKEIKTLSNNLSKSDFQKKLSRLITTTLQEHFKKEKVELLTELSYQDNHKLISKILLLLNVVSTMNSKYSKFPFEKFIEEKWSLEHIHAQNSEDLKTDKQRRILLEEQRLFFKRTEKADILEEINVLLEKNEIEEIPFTNLQEIIFKEYANNESVSSHSIDNMALLATKDNSTLSNNIFPIKRDIIIELDRKGSFIPIGTKNVFLKYYSKNVTQNSIWTKQDREAYLKEITETLTGFLPQKLKINEN